MNNSTVLTEDAFASLLELAANNDVEGFKQFIGHNFSIINEIGLWYGRYKGSNQMVLLHRTPLMVASTYGSFDVVKLIISLPNTNLNKQCGIDNTTALHCAASSGSLNAINVVKLLLEAGADPNLADANGYFPIDVIVVSPKLKNMKHSLEHLLSTSLSPENGSPSSPNSSKFNNVVVTEPYERKEYPVDPSLPDIKNSIYSTDEFRIFSFKVRPCSRAYSHDWTECPFVHPGENARRRDPRKYHYSCVPCPDFRKGACRRGDMCEYAHGVFESWLHPAQYRTRICKDGIACDRRVCFFAHTPEELRPCYASSPRSGSAMSLLPNSPSSPFTPPPLSPSLNGNWHQQSVPALHLPSIQSSRLRPSLTARDIKAEDPEHQQLLNELSRQQTLNELSRQQMLNELSRLTLSHPKSLSPSNLDDLFSAETSYEKPAFSPTHKFDQFQQQKSMLSPGPSPISPMSARVAMLREKQQVNFRSLSSRDLGGRSVANVDTRGDSWMNYGGSSSGAPVDWTVNADEHGKELKNNVEEPDFGWVHSLMTETPEEIEAVTRMVEGGVRSSREGSSNGPD